MHLQELSACCSGQKRRIYISCCFGSVHTNQTSLSSWVLPRNNIAAQKLQQSALPAHLHVLELPKSVCQNCRVRLCGAFWRLLCPLYHSHRHWRAFCTVGCRRLSQWGRCLVHSSAQHHKLAGRLQHQDSWGLALLSLPPSQCKTC